MSCKWTGVLGWSAEEKRSRLAGNMYCSSWRLETGCKTFVDGSSWGFARMTVQRCDLYAAHCDLSAIVNQENYMSVQPWMTLLCVAGTPSSEERKLLLMNSIYSALLKSGPDIVIGFHLVGPSCVLIVLIRQDWNAICKVAISKAVSSGPAGSHQP